MVIEARTSEAPQRSIIRYPLGLRAVRSVMRPVMENTSQSWKDYAREQSSLLEEENPYASSYLNQLSVGFPEDTADEFGSGIALAYRIFEKKAVGGKLPVLTLEFVEGYNAKIVDRLTKVYGSPNSVGAHREELMRTTLFALLERDVYDVLQEELAYEGESIFDTPILQGFVMSYFLFRKGFSDAKNWEKELVDKRQKGELGLV